MRKYKYKLTYLGNTIIAGNNSSRQDVIIGIIGKDNKLLSKDVSYRTQSKDKYRVPSKTQSKGLQS